LFVISPSVATAAAMLMRLSAKIGVERAQDYSGVVRSPVLMKAEKVAAIVGRQNPVLSRRKR
jgi:hypothetical protein